MNFILIWYKDQSKRCLAGDKSGSDCQALPENLGLLGFLLLLLLDVMT